VVSFNYIKKGIIVLKDFVSSEIIDKMEIKQPIQRLVFHDIYKPLRRHPGQCSKGYCEFCVKSYSSKKGSHGHARREHNSSFQDAIAKYYDLATVLLNPNFQLVWERFESTSVGLEDFEAHIDPECKVKFSTT
jgi:hypothetical protein